jgi:environmental stress-induced protein Ves
MEYSIITSENFKPTRWPGGSTTELYIFPHTAKYHQRNFKFRLSTATVETEESDFTILNGISRKLMVLEGTITLSHKDHFTRQLNKFDLDEFEGVWQTSSIGKGTDFNLMTSDKTSGKLSAIVIKKDQFVDCRIKEMCDWFFIFIHSGKIRIDLDKKIRTIAKGDLLIINNITTRAFEINGIEKSELIFSEITL